MNIASNSVKKVLVHITVKGPERLVSQILAEEINLSIPEAINRILIGSVYYQPSNVSDTSKVDRLLQDRPVKENDYLRIHTDPRFYPEAHSVDWKKRILYNGSDYVVLNKPRGVPCHATAANYYENVIECLKSNVIELEETDLYLPHRLDTNTSGILLLAKGEESIKKLAKIFQSRELVKVYKALITYKVRESNDTSIHCSSNTLFSLYHPGDSLISFQHDTKLLPKPFYWTQEPETKHCELKILSVSNPIQKKTKDWRELFSNLSKEQSIEYDDQELCQAMDHWTKSLLPEEIVAFQEVELQLVTGRTHQVRGQLHAFQFYPPSKTNEQMSSFLEYSQVHIAGDSLYRGLTSDHDVEDIISPYLALQAAKLSFYEIQNGQKNIVEYHIDKPWWHRLFDLAKE